MGVMDGWREVMDVREIQNVWWRECLGRWSRRPLRGKSRLGAVQSEPWLIVDEPWLGVEPRLDGSTWLSCGSHLIDRKAEKCLRLD
ncbi:hypothetical protein CRG98_049496 [Punica granatum]|uniref:Uncharacterized protein n=1 Tax=Punica granatum TaxID=22663 RepID=A0A2I0HEM4_PUNGR|nr:hypothetical protein CRG98_049496 [Punica granatum]